MRSFLGNKFVLGQPRRERRERRGRSYQTEPHMTFPKLPGIQDCIPRLLAEDQRPRFVEEPTQSYADEIALV